MLFNSLKSIHYFFICEIPVQGRTSKKKNGMFQFYIIKILLIIIAFQKCTVQFFHTMNGGFVLDHSLHSEFNQTQTRIPIQKLLYFSVHNFEIMGFV